MHVQVDRSREHQTPLRIEFRGRLEFPKAASLLDRPYHPILDQDIALGF
jgi:hypothetical protein